MRSHRLLPPAVLVAVLVAAAGCGSSSSSSSSSSSPKASTAVNPNGPEVSPSGDIPDNQAYVPYAAPGQGLTVKVPEGWARTTTAAGVTFTDKLNAIAIKVVSAAKAPTAGSVSAPQGGHVSTVQRTSGSAVRVTYLAQSAPDPVTGKTRVDAVERYLFFHRGKELVLTLSGPKGADNVDPWKLVTNSVAWR